MTAISTMNARQRIKFGERNSELSEELFKNGKYYDWVVTTCFYATVHLVEGKVLPCTVNNITCNNIGEVRRALNCEGRHQARKELVKLKIPRLTPFYMWLDDNSRYSRYKSYNIQKNVAEKAKQYLKKIQDHCTSEGVE